MSGFKIRCDNIECIKVECDRNRFNGKVCGKTVCSDTEMDKIQSGKDDRDKRNCAVKANDPSIHSSPRKSPCHNSVLQHFDLNKPSFDSVTTIAKSKENKNDSIAESVTSRCKGLFCDICRKSFTSAECLEIHKFTRCGEHIPTKPQSLTCTVMLCSRIFDQESCLREHFHHLSRVFSCEVCEKTYNLRSSLERHENVHQISRLFSCKVCRKTFTYKSIPTKDVQLQSDVCHHCKEEMKSVSSTDILCQQHKFPRENLLQTGKPHILHDRSILEPESKEKSEADRHISKEKLGLTRSAKKRATLFLHNLIRDTYFQRS